MPSVPRPVDSPQTKVCTKCDEAKSLELFARKGRGRDSRCKACRAEYLAAWRLANQESLKVKDRDYRARCRASDPEGFKARARERDRRCRERRTIAPEVRLARLDASRARYATDPEYRASLVEKAREYRRQNADKVRALNRRRYAANKEVYFACNHRRRARLKGAGGSHTAAEWRALKAAFGHRCLMCGRQEPEIRLTRDHIVPIAAGGRNDIDNIQPLCKPCNSRKSLSETDLRPATT